METPERQIRAFYKPEFIRVYQAYSDDIAEVALTNQTFVSPPLKMERMTWIKPSFLWMMYRAGWGKKDEGQRRILAIDITHDGFAWALAHSISSHRPDDLSLSEWTQLKIDQPVRIQWDPERDLHLNPIAHRAIQIGLSGEAVIRYVEHWIVEITDVTKLASTIHEKVKSGQLDEATALLPKETPYTPTTGQTVG